jgi:hypothetical protein
MATESAALQGSPGGARRDVNVLGVSRCFCVVPGRIVGVLERVQGGIIGQTLSSFGITGLYITFVFGIGRFLRFSTQNARMRIQYEDLPTTKRLVALCQVCVARSKHADEQEAHRVVLRGSFLCFCAPSHRTGAGMETCKRCIDTSLACFVCLCCCLERNFWGLCCREGKEIDCSL